jgi:hypothetical protein
MGNHEAQSAQFPDDRERETEYDKPSGKQLHDRRRNTNARYQETQWDGKTQEGDGIETLIVRLNRDVSNSTPNLIGDRELLGLSNFL